MKNTAPTNRYTAILSLWLIVLWPFSNAAFGGDFPDRVTSFQARVGTLQYNLERLTFKWAGGEEIFDISRQHIVTSNAWRPNKLPGLEEFGVRSIEGILYEYGDKSKSEFWHEINAEHRDRRWKSWVFKNLFGKIVELNWKGETPIIRVDISLGDGLSNRSVVWSNLQTKDILFLNKNSGLNKTD